MKSRRPRKQVVGDEIPASAIADEDARPAHAVIPRVNLLHRNYEVRAVTNAGHLGTGDEDKPINAIDRLT